MVQAEKLLLQQKYIGLILCNFNFFIKCFYKKKFFNFFYYSALDYTTNRVYFADSKLDYIDFVNYDGSGRTQVLASTKFVQHPHAMAIFEDMIYYSDRRLQRLQFYPKYPNGTSTEYPSHTFSKALGVVAVHPVLQPKVAKNPCKDFPCTHICLISKKEVKS